MDTKQAGGSATAEAMGMRYAELPRTDWPDELETRHQIEADWEEPWGDRRQELVFIGAAMNRAEILEGLAQCLLTDAEMKLGEEGWAEWPDPFPAWGGEAGVPLRRRSPRVISSSSPRQLFRARF